MCKAHDWEDDLRQARWEEYLVAYHWADHFGDAGHAVTYWEYAERLDAVLGEVRVGRATRHMTRSNNIRPFTYFYHGAEVDSPSSEGCPLPTKTCVERDIGDLRGLAVAV